MTAFVCKKFRTADRAAHFDVPLIGIYPTIQSSAVPIVRLHVIEQALPTPPMKAQLTPEDRLWILRTEDQFKPWTSLDDERFCILCQRKFNGRQVEVRRLPNGRHGLHCPTERCDSRPHEWVYPRARRISDIVDSDWWSASDKAPRKVSRLSGHTQFQRQKHA